MKIKCFSEQGVIQRSPVGERPAAGGKGGGIAYPLSPCEVLPEVQRQAAP